METRYAHCETTGCTNEGIGIPVLMPEPPVGVVCGVCGHTITDLSDTPPEQVTEMPPWEL